MRIEIGFAQPGKMFAAAQHSGFAQPAQKFTGIKSNLFRIVGYRARAEDGVRCGKCQIEAGCEVHTESKSSAILTDEAPVLSEELAPAGGMDFRRCG